jgi:hypothetical protein
MRHSLEPAKGWEVQVHHLISLDGWNDVLQSIYYVYTIQLFYKVTAVYICVTWVSNVYPHL